MLVLELPNKIDDLQKEGPEIEEKAQFTVLEIYERQNHRHSRHLKNESECTMNYIIPELSTNVHIQ